MLPQILTFENRGFMKVFLKAKRVQRIFLEDRVKLKGIKRQDSAINLK
jgi:hypothetical protein